LPQILSFISCFFRICIPFSLAFWFQVADHPVGFSRDWGMSKE
jgi:hypothetical protein